MNRLSINWYLEKTIDLLEMCPLENQFQDFIVYPVLDEIIHRISVCDMDLVDCHNFRQYNTESHDRRSYSVLVKAVPDLLIAKNFFFNNRKGKIYDALKVIAAVEVKEPNNTWMLGREFVKDSSLDGKEAYKDDLYVELLPSLVKNKKVILTNIRKWEVYSIDNIRDKELLKAIQIYVRAIELCGFDSYTDYEASKDNSRNKTLKVDSVKERIEKLREIHEIEDVVTGYKFDNKNSFDELVKRLDKKYMCRIKDVVRQSHVQTWDIIKNREFLNVNRYDSADASGITAVSDFDYDPTEWESLKEGVQFLIENS